MEYISTPFLRSNGQMLISLKGEEAEEVGGPTVERERQRGLLLPCRNRRNRREIDGRIDGIVGRCLKWRRDFRHSFRYRSPRVFLFLLRST